eukprot:13666070-Alexandrium_andersonii.AAC.1
MHPSGASGINFEAVPGPAKLKLRPPQATSHVPGSECSTATGAPFTVTKQWLLGGSTIPLL